MYIITGGAGFIGSQLVKLINQYVDDVIVVDDLTQGQKFANLTDCMIQDYIDKDDFLAQIQKGGVFNSSIKAVFHQGACSTTTEWDGRYMMKNNYDYSKDLLHYCLERKIPFIYASSAAVYGASKNFKEIASNENPLNVYGYSKLLFDQYVRRILPGANSQVVGLRYFNVYGPGEQCKGSMASVAYHFNQQIQQSGKVKLFEGCDGYEAGEQQRDFVYVDDITNLLHWFYNNRKHSGIFNAGTGRSQTFNDVAKAVIAWHKRGDIEYIPFPEKLREAYQSYTQADISTLQQAGCDVKFKTVEEGVKDYLDRING